MNNTGTIELEPRFMEALAELSTEVATDLNLDRIETVGDMVTLVCRELQKVQRTDGSVLKTPQSIVRGMGFVSKWMDTCKLCDEPLAGYETLGANHKSCMMREVDARR
ncbi:MAG: hypothetical protein KDA84_26560 [Planctomycetaceae bacterium]|nr:hypothetical protein [Planctomycetaceae bacterium]